MRTVILFFEGVTERIEYFKPLLAACCADHRTREHLDIELSCVSHYPHGGLRISVEDGKIVSSGHNDQLVSPASAIGSGTLGWFERPEAFLDMATCSMAAMLGTSLLEYSVAGTGLWDTFTPLGLTDQSGVDFTSLELTQRCRFGYGNVFDARGVYPPNRGIPHYAVQDAQRVLRGRPPAEREPRASVADESLRRAATRSRRAVPADKRYGVHPVQSLRSVEILPLPR